MDMDINGYGVRGVPISWVLAYFICLHHTQNSRNSGDRSYQTPSPNMKHSGVKLKEMMLPYAKNIFEKIKMESYQH